MEDPIQSLKRFVQDNSTTKEKEQYEKDIKISGHQRFIDAFINYCLLKKESKRGAVWLWGESNTGKSTLLKMLERIFTLALFK